MTGYKHYFLPVYESSLDSDCYIPKSHPPRAFWDTVSKIWLTKDALRELNRRNRQSSSRKPRLQSPRPFRPVTRHLYAELKSRVIQSASDFLRHCSPKTLNDIKLFARHGGPDLSDLKVVSMNYAGFISGRKELMMLFKFSEPVCFFNHTMSSSETNARGRKRGPTFGLDERRSTKRIKTSQSSGPYGRNFEQKLINNGIYLDEYEYPDGRIPPEPINMEKISQRLMQRRLSLSSSHFSNERFKEFRRANAHASNESKVFKTVIPFIEGKIADDKCVEGEVFFTNLEPLANNIFTAAKADLYYGARPEQLDPRVRDELDGHLIPSSTQDDFPIAPNFFLADKGPKGILQDAKLQACYDGALGARGMHSLQAYGKDESTYDNAAYTITSTYLAGFLQIYTVHPIPPAIPGGRTEYCMNLLRSFAINDTAETFRQGVTGYRNARDWAKEQRDEAIKRSNEKVKDRPVERLAVNASSGKISRFPTAGSPEEASPNEALSKDSPISLHEGSDVTAKVDKLESSKSKNKVPARRSNRLAKQSRQARRTATRQP